MYIPSIRMKHGIIFCINISTRGKAQHYSEKIMFSYGSFILLLRIPKISGKIVLRYFSFIFATEW